MHKRHVIIGLSVILLFMIYFFKNASFMLRAVSSIAFLVFFYAVDHSFDIRFKARHYLFIIIITIASLLLSPLYFVYPQYDKIQHFFQPMLIAAIMYYMIAKLPIDNKWKITFTFFVTLAILGLFEIGEYMLDFLFDLKLQGVYLRDLHGLEKFNLLVEPIDDTMIDLLLGTLGTSVYCWMRLKIHKKQYL